MPARNAKEIISRYLSGICTDEERAWVENWYAAHATHASSTSISEERLQASAERMWLEIQPDPQIQPDQPVLVRRPAVKIKRSKAKNWWWAAAAVLILGLGGLLWKMTRNAPWTDTSERILAGGNRATLTFSDGAELDLRQDQPGIIIGGDGIQYLDGSPVLSTSSAKSRTLVLTTPKGGQYQVTLEDGTKVWLNAASRLIYSEKFSDGERVVELEGEAYFDVSKRIRQDKSAIPFQVRTKNQWVEVLGTQFNIKAYRDEQDTKTTLVEGTVKVHSVSDLLNPTESFVLAPGEQAIGFETRLSKQAVDVRPYIAWMKGEFVFKATPLKEVFRQLSRWYDIEVDYATMPDEKIHGVIQRDKPLSSILQTIEKTSGLKFKTEERRVALVR